MSQELQFIFNVIAGIAGVLGMFIMKNMWDSIKDLRDENGKLVKAHTEISVLVAGQYAKREDVTEMGREIFRKLDAIMDKLDKKADKV